MYIYYWSNIMHMQKNRFSFVLACFIGFAGFSQASLASSSEGKKDPYLLGMETYAKENSALKESIEAYKKDLKAVMQKKPELDESTNNNAE